MAEPDLTLVVRTTVAEVLGVPVDEITADTDLRTEHDVDSLELLEIGTRVERALGRRIAVSDVVSAQTVEQAVNLLRARLAEGNGDAG